LKEQLQHLARLQEIDDEIDGHESNLARLPKEIQEIARNLVTLRREIGEKKEKLSEVEKNVRQKERDLETEQEKIKLSEKRLLNIKNQKEYNALSRQIKLGKKVVAEVEEALLEFMEQTERLNVNLARQEKEYAGFEARLSEKKAEEEKARADAEKVLKSLGEERNGTLEGVDREFLKKYQTVKNALGVAVAHVDNGSCTACHMALPPQLNIRVLKQEEILTCPTCQRILYVKPENVPEYNKID